MYIAIIVGGVILLILIYLFLFLWSVNIPDYMAARHYRFGKPTTDGPISGKRVLVVPTFDQLVMIDQRIQKSTLENIAVLTKERQRMSLSIILIWKPDDAAKTINSIKAEDIEPTFFKIAEFVIKDESSKMNVDEILENRNFLSKNVKKAISETATSWGISLSSVNISNIVVVNKSFMQNMALPKEIELEKKSKLAELNKELEVELKSIEKDKKSEIAKLEYEKTVGMTREEVTHILQKAEKDRELFIKDLEEKIEVIASKIKLMQLNVETDAEAQKLKAMLIAETEGLREKLQVTNTCTESSIRYELQKTLPEIYKNITMGDVTLFDNGANGDKSDFGNLVASSALTMLSKIGKESTINKQEIENVTN